MGNGLKVCTIVQYKTAEIFNCGFSLVNEKSANKS
jgi:hypothetical protein